MKNIAIIVGAGKGKRMGSKAKTFLTLNKIPLLVHSAIHFEQSSLIDEIILVIRKNKIKTAESLVKKNKLKKVTKIIKGGEERQDSVYNALKSIDEADLILVHDVARPFIDQRLIKSCVDVAKKHKAVIPAVLVRDTVKKGRGFVEATVSRDDLWLIQTPQVFEFKLLRKAYNKAKKNRYFGTDDASLVEHLGKKIKIVQGYYDNIKITFPSDIKLGEFLLKKGKRE